jgi:peptide chain release factor
MNSILLSINAPAPEMARAALHEPTVNLSTRKPIECFIMARFGISEEKESALTAKMESLGIREQDLEEQFVRSGGHGGQNVNKVATCVYLKHLPSGTEVKCQEERSQALNRYRARQILVKKLEEKILGRESEERQRIEKVRRQKRKRSKRAKMKMLADKRHDAALRNARKVGPEDLD